MIKKFKCPHCNKGFQKIVSHDFLVELPYSRVTILNAEYFECENCKEKALGESLISKINEIETKEAKKILLTIRKGKELETKAVLFLRQLSGLRAVDLAHKIKISKSTISNWDKKNTKLPYHLSLLLGNLFANKLGFVAIGKSIHNDLEMMIAA